MSEKKSKISTFIQGDTIDLVPMNSDHVKQYTRWFNNPKVRMYSRNETPRTLAEVKKHNEEPREEEPPQSIRFEILHKKDGKPLGLCGLNHINWFARNANLYLLIGEVDYWGKDIATEASKLILKFAFEEVNLHKVYARMFTTNVGSWKTAEKIGLKREATIREEGYLDGKYFDSYYYGLLKEEWKNQEKES